MPRGEFSMLVNSRNDEQTEQIRTAWLHWIDLQKVAPKSVRQAWYGFASVAIKMTPTGRIIKTI